MYQPHNMIKHTRTNRRQQPTISLSASDHFVVLALKGLKICAIFKIVSGTNYIPHDFSKKLSEV